MGTMTIENQMRYISIEQNIIKDIRQRGNIRLIDSAYIRDLETKIEQREKWIRDQGQEGAGQ